MIRAAQYLRMSTDNQRYSIPMQVAAIAAYASSNGFEVVKTYADEGKSGVTTTGRDGLNQLLQDVLSADRGFEAILVLDVSRWGRFQDPDEAAHYEFLCRRSGVAVKYCAEPWENDGSLTASVFKSLKRAMAAEYSRQLSDRCRSSLRRHMLAGGKCGGHPPYGFSRQIFEADGSPGRILGVGDRRGPNQTVRLVHGPQAEMETVRTIFRLFVYEAMGVTAIAHHLNAAGVPYRRSGPWAGDRVQHVLRNEIAVGLYSFNRTTMHLGSAKTANDPADWIKVRIAKPIVSARLYRAAQTKFSELHRNIWTDAEMIAKLRALLKRHGHLTRTLIDRSEEVQGVSAYKRRFGTLEAAFAMLPYVEQRKLRQHVDAAGREPAEIALRLKALLAEKGFLNTAEISRCARLPSIKFIVKQFGSLDAAYFAAGFDISRGQMIAEGRRRGRRSADTSRMMSIGPNAAT